MQRSFITLPNTVYVYGVRSRTYHFRRERCHLIAYQMLPIAAEVHATRVCNMCIRGIHCIHNGLEAWTDYHYYYNRFKRKRARALSSSRCWHAKSHKVKQLTDSTRMFTRMNCIFYIFSDIFLFRFVLDVAIAASLLLCRCESALLPHVASLFFLFLIYDFMKSRDRPSEKERKIESAINNS